MKAAKPNSLSALYEEKLAAEAYNKGKIYDILQSHKVYKPTKTEVETTYKNRLICKKYCSDKYAAFDFGLFVCSMLNVIEEYFTPVLFDLSLVRGFQEIRLKGAELHLNGENYMKMLTLSSSSNGYYPLSVNAGLLRQVCENGLMIGVEGASFNSKTRHYSAAIEALVAGFQNSLPKIEHAFATQTELLLQIGNGPVSLRHFLKSYIKQNKDGEPIGVLVENTKRLMRKLKDSESDRLDMNVLTANQKNAIESPLMLTAHVSGYDDVMINRTQIFNCYTEVFRKRPAAVIEKETTRVYNVLNQI